MKKFLSVLIIAALLFSALPLTAFAAESGDIAVGTSGTTGDCAWELNEYGALTISGNGAMADYASAADCPWYAEKDNVNYIIVDSGVTRVGDYAFDGLKNAKTANLYNGLQTIGKSAFNGTAIKSVAIPEGVTDIENSAFKNCGSLKYVSLPGSLANIGGSAFAGTALDSVIIPNEDAKIGFMSFGFDTKMQKDDSFVVYGHEGSTAWTYANSFAFPFVAYDGIARNITVHLGDAYNVATNQRVSKACTGERIMIKKWDQSEMYITGYTSSDVEIENIDGTYYFTMPATSVEVYIEGSYPTAINVDLSDDEPCVLSDEKAEIVKAQIVSYVSSVHGSATRYDLDCDFNEDIEISGNTVTKLDTSSIKSSVSFNTNRPDYSPVNFIFAEETINRANLNVTLPCAGDEYDYTPDVAVEIEPCDDPHFTVTSAHWYNEWGVAPATFEGGQKYFIEMTLTPDEGYAFTGNCSVGFRGVPEFSLSSLVSKSMDLYGNLNVATVAVYIPGEAHNITVFGGMASYDKTETNNDNGITEACAGERVWVTAGVDDIADDEYVLPGTYRAYSDDVAFVGEEMYSFIMPNEDVAVSLDYETGEIFRGTVMDLRNGAEYEADAAEYQNAMNENGAIFNLLRKFAYKTKSEWNDETGVSVIKFDLDGDESYDLAKADNKYYLLETSSLSDPRGKFDVSVEKEDSLFTAMRSLTIIFADSTLEKHKVTVSGGHATTKSDDYAGKYSVTEAYEGERLYVLPNLSDLGDDGYFVQTTSELFLNGEEVGFEGPAQFEMPDCDANVELVYEKGEQIKGVMDLRTGSYTAPEYQRYAMSELYGMYIILHELSADIESDFNDQTYEWIFRFDVDGDSRFDIQLDQNARTFSLLPTNSLDPESGRVTLTMPREESYTIPMRNLTILLSGTDEEQTPHKITVIGGFATVGEGDKATEQYEGEPVFLNSDPSAAPEGKYIVDVTFESDDVEIYKENGNYFIMPGKDVTVTAVYEFGDQIPVTLDLTNGSETFDDQEMFYTIGDILNQNSKDSKEYYSEGVGDFVYDYDLDGDGKWDIQKNDATFTFTKLNNELKGVRVLTLSADKVGAYHYYPLTVKFSEVKIGDVNNDGSIDVLDATMIEKYAVEKITLTDEQKYVADVNNDGAVDILDATLIKKYAVEKINEFPKKG